jgi:hypothetical protein
MMVVVPTLTEQLDAEKRVVRGMVRRRIAPGSEPVAHEVHADVPWTPRRHHGRQ